MSRISPFSLGLDITRAVSTILNPSPNQWKSFVGTSVSTVALSKVLVPDKNAPIKQYMCVGRKNRLMGRARSKAGESSTSQG